jgi:uncharacterized membrane protein
MLLFFRSVLAKIEKPAVRVYWFLVVLFAAVTSFSLYYFVFPHELLSDALTADFVQNASVKFAVFMIIGISFVIVAAFLHVDNFKKKMLYFLISVILSVLSIVFKDKSQLFNFISLNFLALSIAIFINLSLFKTISGALKKYHRLILAVVGVFFVLFLLLSVFRHMTFNSHAYDMGLYSQAFYKFAHFDFDNTVRKVANIWGDHFTVIFIPLSWLYWLFPFSVTLLVLQSLIVSLGAIPLYLLARDMLKSRAAGLMLAGSYLAGIGLASAISFDFHFITISTAFFLLTFYLAYKKRWLWYFISLLVLLGCKEDISVIVVFLGIFLIYYRGWKVGLATSFLGLAWFLFVSKILMPSISTDGFIYFSYSVLGQTPVEAIKNTITHPIHVLRALIDSPIKQTTLLNYFSSLGFLPIFAPIMFIFALPSLGENLWNDNPSRWGGFHYESMPTAVLIVVAVFAIYNISRLVRPELRHKTIILLACFVLISTLMVDLYSRTSLIGIFKKSQYEVTQEGRSTYKVMAEIPKNASVTANHSLVPHLALRDQIYEYPGCRPEDKCLNTDYFVLSLAGSSWPFTKQDMVNEINNFLNQEGFREHYGLYRHDGAAFVFKNGYQADPSVLLEAENYIKEYDAPQGY